jgi:Glyoxalase-like domain
MSSPPAPGESKRCHCQPCPPSTTFSKARETWWCVLRARVRSRRSPATIPADTSRYELSALTPYTAASSTQPSPMSAHARSAEDLRSSRSRPSVPGPSAGALTGDLLAGPAHLCDGLGHRHIGVLSAADGRLSRLGSLGQRLIESGQDRRRVGVLGHADTVGELSAKPAGLASRIAALALGAAGLSARMIRCPSTSIARTRSTLLKLGRIDDVDFQEQHVGGAGSGFIPPCAASLAAYSAGSPACRRLATRPHRYRDRPVRVAPATARRWLAGPRLRQQPDDPAMDRLITLGATVVHRYDDITVMQDPEGNEFCVEPGPNDSHEASDR